MDTGRYESLKVHANILIVCYRVYLCIGRIFLSQNFRCNLCIGHKYKQQYSCQGISIELVQIESNLQKYPIQSCQSD